MREIAVLLVHCNGMKADKADAWVLLRGFAASGEWHECGNRCFTRLAESKAPGSIHRKQLPLMSSSTSNARWMTAYSTTPNGLTSARHLLLKELHCTFQRKSKQRTKCRSTKTYLLLFQKASTTICCTGLQSDRRCSRAQKAPAHESFRECQREQIHLCLLDGLTQEQSSAVKLYIRN